MVLLTYEYDSPIVDLWNSLLFSGSGSDSDARSHYSSVHG